MNCGILHDLEMNATALVFKPSYVKAEPPASYIGHILRVFFFNFNGFSSTGILRAPISILNKLILSAD